MTTTSVPQGPTCSTSKVEPTSTPTSRLSWPPRTVDYPCWSASRSTASRAVGIEVDRIPGALEPMATVLDDYPFDIRLGSVHWLGSWLFDDYHTPAFAQEWETRDASTVWATYVDAVAELAASGMVDVLAHLDVIKVAGHRPDDCEAHQVRLVDAVIASGLTVEVSSAGWRKPADEMYPAPAVLDRLLAAGVAVTTASDAHEPGHLGAFYDRLEAELTARGVTELTSFDRRVPRPVPL